MSTNAQQLPSTRKAWRLKQYAGEKLDVEKTFALEEESLAAPKSGEITVQQQWLALEPTMRNSISERKSYIPPLPLGSVMWAFSLGQIIASEDSEYPVGALIFSNRIGMTDVATIKPADIKAQPGAVFQLVSQEQQSKFDPRELLSATGPPGLAAYVGLFSKHVGDFRQGDVVLVDGAAGATGNFVIQMAKAKGASKIIAVASGRKRQACIDAGADEFVAYDEDGFEKKLHDATQDKVTLYFGNIGGHIFEEGMTTVAPFGRVAVCGIISEYDDKPYGNKSIRSILINRLKIKGFICGDKENEVNPFPPILEMLEKKQIHSSFTEFEPAGLENTPKALLGLFAGANTGKMVIKL